MLATAGDSWDIAEESSFKRYRILRYANKLLLQSTERCENNVLLWLRDVNR